MISNLSIIAGEMTSIVLQSYAYNQKAIQFSDLDSLKDDDMELPQMRAYSDVR